MEAYTSSVEAIAIPGAEPRLMSGPALPKPLLAPIQSPESSIKAGDSANSSRGEPKRLEQNAPVVVSAETRARWELLKILVSGENGGNVSEQRGALESSPLMRDGRTQRNSASRWSQSPQPTGGSNAGIRPLLLPQMVGENGALGRSISSRSDASRLDPIESLDDLDSHGIRAASLSRLPPQVVLEVHDRQNEISLHPQLRTTQRPLSMATGQGLATYGPTSSSSTSPRPPEHLHERRQHTGHSDPQACHPNLCAPGDDGTEQAQKLSHQATSTAWPLGSISKPVRAYGTPGLPILPLAATSPRQKPEQQRELKTSEQQGTRFSRSLPPHPTQPPQQSRQSASAPILARPSSTSSPSQKPQDGGQRLEMVKQATYLSEPMQARLPAQLQTVHHPAYLPAQTPNSDMSNYALAMHSDRPVSPASRRMGEISTPQANHANEAGHSLDQGRLSKRQGHELAVLPSTLNPSSEQSISQESYPSKTHKGPNPQTVAPRLSAAGEPAAGMSTNSHLEPRMSATPPAALQSTQVPLASKHTLQPRAQNPATASSQTLPPNASSSTIQYPPMHPGLATTSTQGPEGRVQAKSSSQQLAQATTPPVIADKFQGAADNPSGTAPNGKHNFKTTCSPQSRGHVLQIGTRSSQELGNRQNLNATTLVPSSIAGIQKPSNKSPAPVDWQGQYVRSQPSQPPIMQAGYTTPRPTSASPAHPQTPVVPASSQSEAVAYQQPELTRLSAQLSRPPAPEVLSQKSAKVDSQMSHHDALFRPPHSETPQRQPLPYPESLGISVKEYLKGAKQLPPAVIAMVQHMPADEIEKYISGEQQIPAAFQAFLPQPLSELLQRLGSSSVKPSSPPHDTHLGLQTSLEAEPSREPPEAASIPVRLSHSVGLSAPATSAPPPVQPEAHSCSPGSEAYYNAAPRLVKPGEERIALGSVASILQRFSEFGLGQNGASPGGEEDDIVALIALFASEDIPSINGGEDLTKLFLACLLAACKLYVKGFIGSVGTRVAAGDV